jgi:hypothetical protein
VSKICSSLLIFCLLVTVFPVVADEFALLNGEKIGDFNMGLSEKDLEKKINCPLKRGKEELWGADGIYHQTWNYPACGLRFGMSSAQEGGSKTVDSITMTAPSMLKTKRGIQIGSTEKAVIKAYSHEKDAEDSIPKETFIAGSLYGGLIFNFKNNRVTEIFLGASAE